MWTDQSAAVMMSLETLTKAVSVECNLQKPDWKVSRMLDCSSAITSSSILDKKGSLQMGLNLFISVESVCFLCA